MDVSDRYSSSLASLLHSVTGSLPHACSPGVNPGAINQDFRLARSVSDSLNSSSQELMETSIPLGSNWNSVDSGSLCVTIDSSRGGFSLQGVGLPSSPSIARFSSNPGFAERAARFSAFGNGHFSNSFPVSESGSMRSASQPYEIETKLAKMSTRGEFASGVRGSSDVSGKSQANGIERTVEGEEVKSRLYRSSSAGCSSPQADEGRDLSDMERTTTPSEPGVANGIRGQETSGADADQGRSVVTHLSGKKRKSTADEAVKDAPSPVIKDQKSTGAQSKRSKGAEEKDDQKSKAERSDNSSSNSQAKDSKHVEHPKTDYIHVRARRGQATDSHSLAERVRREKISERMKFLQDLVPGCSKVTGKAVMLDEIINYVQSIQRQVEFLSMKLAAVTPPTDFNIDSFLTKQLQMGQTCGLPNMVEHPEASLPYPQLTQLHSQQSLNMQQSLANGLDRPHCVESTLRRMNSAPMILPRTPADMFGDGISQIRGLWEGDLHSVVQMGFNQARPSVSLGGFQCDLPPGHMKVEL